MGRYKTLFKNTLIFSISNFASKLLAFFMLPIYTRAMTTGDFGSSDVVNTTVGLLVPIFTLSIAGGAMRFAMNRGSNSKIIFSFGLKVIFSGFGVLILAYPIIIKIDILGEYIGLFYFTYISSSIYTYLNQFARGIGKIKLVGVAGVFSTIVAFSFGVVLLLFLQMGVRGFLLSYIFSYITGSVVLFYWGKMYRFLYFEKSEKKITSGMLKYSIPLAPNSISWWLHNSANRYIIAAFCGLEQVGLFGVAARIPTVLITLQGIFYQAWQLSAIDEFEKADKVEFFSEVYKLYNVVMLLSCSALIPFVRAISNFLFSGDFFPAWRYVPFLLVSVIFGALSGFLGSFYSASMQTRMLFITTLMGAIIAIIANFVLIPIFGIMGSSLTSVIAYLSVWIFRLVDSRKHVQLQIDIKKDCLCYILVLFESVALINSNIVVGYLSSALIFLLLFLLNKKDLGVFFKLIQSKHKQHKKLQKGLL